MALNDAALGALQDYVDVATFAGTLGYRQERVIRENIDRLRIPYITVRRRRWVRPADYIAAIERDARPARPRGRPKKLLCE